MLVAVSCVRVWGSANCTLVMKFRAKAQRRKENDKRISLRLPLRLYAFARNYFLKTCVLVVFLNACVLSAQANTRVTISMPAPGEIRVEAELSSPTHSWSFRNTY